MTTIRRQIILLKYFIKSIWATDNRVLQTSSKTSCCTTYSCLILWPGCPVDFAYLLCCSFRQESFPLCTGDMEIGATHPSITADTHTGPGEAGVLTETALLNTKNTTKTAVVLATTKNWIDHDKLGRHLKHILQLSIFQWFGCRKYVPPPKQQSPQSVTERSLKAVELPHKMCKGKKIKLPLICRWSPPKMTKQACCCIALCIHQCDNSLWTC